MKVKKPIPTPNESRAEIVEEKHTDVVAPIVREEEHKPTPPAPSVTIVDEVKQI